MINSPIPDMLTRVRNRLMRSHHTVSFPFSKHKFQICQKLKEIGFFLEVWRAKDRFSSINVKVRYFNQYSTIEKISSVSKPSQRIYLKSSQLAKISFRKTIYLISTSKGLLTSKEAFEQKVGGEVLLKIN